MTFSFTRDQRLRTVRFAPFRSNIGQPTFTLTTWDTYRTARDGKAVLGYRLSIHEHTNSAGKPIKRARTSILFEGEDMYCSPMHSIDSDQTVLGLMSFLTLRPGDTDSEYFEPYTPNQMAFAEGYAEYLSAEVMFRFDKENN
jgi:hypothetical protein